MKCEICKSEWKNEKALGIHIVKTHKITVKEYYDKYLKLVDKEGICVCGKETDFRGLTYKYDKFCSLKCSQKSKERTEKFRLNYFKNDIHNIQEKREETNFKKYGNKIVNQYHLDPEGAKERFLGKRIPEVIKYLEDNSLILESEYIDNSKKVKIRCKLCNNTFEESIFNIYQRTYKCNCQTVHSRSRGEIEVQDYIKSLISDSFSCNKKINGKEVDILIDSKNIGIDYNGLYWHSELILSDAKNYHKNKLKICNENGIKLIQIFEDEWLFKKEIVKSRLKTILNIDNSLILHARKCIIKEIDNKIKDEFLELNHLQGKDISGVRLGAFYNDELVSVMTFCHPKLSRGYKHSNKQVWELSRFCTKIGYRISGVASRLLKYFKNNYVWKEIFSYADRRWSEGNIYYKLGFELEKVTDPNYFYSKDGIHRIHRFALRKPNNLPENISEQNINRLNGFYRIWDCGNLKFKIINTNFSLET